MSTKLNGRTDRPLAGVAELLDVENTHEPGVRRVVSVGVLWEAGRNRRNPGAFQPRSSCPSTCVTDTII